MSIDRDQHSALPWRIREKCRPDESGCWIWQAADNGRGYGVVYFEGRQQLAHRAIYTILVGDIPNGFEVDHLCRVVQCVNPEHLQAVTPRVNKLRSEGITAINARKTECPAGHPYDVANTYFHEATNRRRCRACNAAGVRRYKSRKREAA